jgi:PKD domain/Short repeat of unknown function (DUF308)
LSSTPLGSREIRALTWGWWLALLIGALSIVAGVIVILKPSNSLSTLAVILGIFILIDGIFEIAGTILGETESRGLLAVIGTLSVIAGVLLISHPLGGVRAVALLLGIWLIAAGVVRLISAFAFPGDRIWRTAAAPDPDASIVEYDWDFGDGYTCFDCGPSTSYTYQQVGKYTVTVTVTDSNFATSSSTIAIDVVPGPPLPASFGPPSSGVHAGAGTITLGGASGACSSIAQPMPMYSRSLVSLMRPGAATLTRYLMARITSLSATRAPLTPAAASGSSTAPPIARPSSTSTPRPSV